MNSAQSPKPQDLQRATKPSCPDEDEVVLGWECANPLLQIENWLRDAAAVAAAVLSSKS